MEPKAYRKKPVVISAMEYAGDKSVAALEAWGVPFGWGDNGELKVLTLEGGGHDLRVGDMIIRGVKGEFYPCRADIFAATYDEA